MRLHQAYWLLLGVTLLLTSVGLEGGSERAPSVEPQATAPRKGGQLWTDLNWQVRGLPPSKGLDIGPPQVVGVDDDAGLASGANPKRRAETSRLLVAPTARSFEKVNQRGPDDCRVRTKGRRPHPRRSRT